MNQFSRTSIALLLLLLVIACSSPAPAPVPASTPTPTAPRVTSESVVRAIGLPVAIAVGESGEATVRVRVQTGYHINANPPTYPYLKATTLEIASADNVVAGAISYPKPLDKKFPFAEKSLAVYEGVTDLKASLKVDKAARKGERSLPATLSIQACDDQVCYAPGKLKIALPVNIK